MVGWGEFANPNMGVSNIGICWGSCLTPTYGLFIFHFLLNYSERVTIFALIRPIAFVGFKPFGQT